MIIEKSGDLFASPQLKNLGHGCNCVGSMGKGIAVAFRRKFKKMAIEYNKLCNRGKYRPGDSFVWQEKGYTVFNLATQKDYWKDKATLERIEASLSLACEQAEELGLTYIAIPRIGAGLGGLNTKDVRRVITDVAGKYPNIDIVFVSHFRPGVRVDYEPKETQ